MSQAFAITYLDLPGIPAGVDTAVSTFRWFEASSIQSVHPSTYRPKVRLAVVETIMIDVIDLLSFNVLIVAKDNPMHGQSLFSVHARAR